VPGAGRDPFEEAHRLERTTLVIERRMILMSSGYAPSRSSAADGPDIGLPPECIFRDNPPGVREALRCVTAGVAGAGGIGSNVSMLLARAGVGRLIAVDHDVVEVANLNRQAYFLDQVGMPKVEALEASIRRIGAGTKVVPVRERLVRGRFCDRFRGCDILVEALDDSETKVQALEEWLAGLPATPIVAVSGIAGMGNPGAMRVERHGSVSLVGDQESALSLGTLSYRVALAASLMTGEAIRILLERYRPPDRTTERPKDGGSS
jgi:sulfur carrier protein ThiS adenylyltransferase